MMYSKHLKIKLLSFIFLTLIVTNSMAGQNIASWYGKAHHGHKTASGKIYNMYEMTAAHKTLKLGTRVKVTNLNNKKSVIVIITDRGPFVRGRIIDLSYAAKTQLSMDGTAPVELEILD